MPTAITSLSNERVKRLVRLQREARARRAERRFCVETERELGRAVEAGFAVEEFWHSPAMIAAPSEVVARARSRAVEVVEASEAVVRKASYRDHASGFVAVLGDGRGALERFDPAKPELVAVVSGLEKPGNLGAIARSAAAAGAGGLLVDRPGFDLYNPNAIRSSTGAVFALPMVDAEPVAIRDWLRGRGVTIIAATPEATVTHLSVGPRAPVAIVLGAEAEGLDAFWREAAEVTLAIHMPGLAVDSLNVAASATVLLFEAARHRVG